MLTLPDTKGQLTPQSVAKYDQISNSPKFKCWLPRRYERSYPKQTRKTRGQSVPRYKLSRVVRKPDICTCENKGADQLRVNREADQRLCFRYIDSTNPLLPKSEISSL